MNLYATSQNGVLIRLTEERWKHIISGHSELISYQAEILATIRYPEKILVGNHQELLAVKQIVSGKYLIVIYRELSEGGFIITAYLTRRLRELTKRQQIWP
ncbi:MAG: hypothetical protein EWV50_09555 [Microcystis aeruginosa Ma_MB_F_20061100_S20]|uniref:Phage-Barnase-EndoU-ColicinE5/D-RelE like nuclease 2 domain-containing protein n=1 Tax=Microcystis aeruginosa Ma_MB_F_20061100_S20D TaxID=2486253 RepID=A0A552EGR9_MICAE|nr:MAG: hypothetical protein EWV78_14660 [Microcystis aeruginosa Ma_MB_F_20061100_S20D]TRU39740.1 MAG: hypothetical protein EWV50_09555 [Microcystis aeruginosa Ma_MB_F_20061100_S20]